ncbi:dTDP-4-dehydrorhamnose 3,5-epimerase family protein [Candidatus Micrarchaeota archaeon]|nr:dTDP-4-dehydrorhamnose 3,5-epimerase family protein [Candidatus Micrarchaeota archaeon]
MLEGVKVTDIKKLPDERGFFAEVFRQDWKDFVGNDKIVQVNLSMVYPGIIKAWHRHKRGQVDYFIVPKGAIKLCIYDESKKQLDDITLSGERLQIARVPGHYWHGNKTLGFEPSLIIYFVTNLYNYKNPDEERKTWNDPSIIDGKTGKPFDWNMSPHK